MTSSHPPGDELTEAAQRSETRLREDVGAGGFAVALSGGGHRATLAAFGSLLALADRGLNERVLQIASVSGGSITNAITAQRCDFRKVTAEEYERIVTDGVQTIIRRGVLTRGWIIAVAGGALGLVVIPTVLSNAVGAPAWIGLVLGVVLAAAMFLFAGHLIQFLLDRRLLRAGGDHTIRFGDRPAQGVDHVFCATDLVTGLPLYVSTAHGGMFWRRIGDLQASIQARSRERNRALMQTGQIRDWSFAEIVRASAAFPGIAPRRRRMPADPGNADVSTAPSVVFLADGGVWNNLGTQVLREDNFFGLHSAVDLDGVLRPFDHAGPAIPVLIMNGSAPLRRGASRVFAIPGAAFVYGILRVLQILNSNSVVPRVHAMQRSFERRVWQVQVPNHHDPLDLVADLEDVAVTQRVYAHPYEEEAIRRADPQVVEWEKTVVRAVRFAVDHPNINQLEYILQTPEPPGAYPQPGFTDNAGWRGLIHSGTWREMVEREGHGDVHISTTLDKIAAPVARRILARAYLNTYIASLYLQPFDERELSHLAMFSDRLDRIIGTLQKISSFEGQPKVACQHPNPKRGAVHFAWDGASNERSLQLL